MKTIISSEKLEIFYTPEEISELELGAKLLKDNFYCDVKILSTNISGVARTITVEITQNAPSSNDPLDKTQLEEKIEDLFLPYISKHVVLYIRPKLYKPTIVDVVTPQWLQEKMFSKGVRKSDFITDTGIDKTNLSAWINGMRPMSQPVKAMFYFYLIRPTDPKQHLHAFYEDLRDVQVGSKISVCTEYITEADIRSAIVTKAKQLDCLIYIGKFDKSIAEIEFSLAKKIAIDDLKECNSN